MAYEQNRDKVAVVSRQRCRKRYGRDGGFACVKGVDFAVERARQTKGGSAFSKEMAKRDCEEWLEYGDPEHVDKCLGGIKLFYKGLDDIGPRLAGRKRRR